MPKNSSKFKLDYSAIKKVDPELASLIQKEEERQADTLNLIASENYPSRAVRQALSSIFVVKYSEGRPGKRYYAGMENVDKLERLAEERALNLFVGKNHSDWAANLQPLSGSPANYAAYRGLLEKGDKIMSLVLAQGGHLTHGAKVSLSGMDYRIVHYALDEKTETLDYQAVKELAIKEKPRLIICGYSAYPRKIDFQKFREAADACGAYLMADIAHIAGLVAAQKHPSPFPWADVVTFTTHKTLRGPRGAVLICRQELKDRIFSKVFPGLQGGPHNHTIAAIALALKEASLPAFKSYSSQVIKNAQVLAESLKQKGFRLVSGGTDNHLMLIDLSNKGVWGEEAQELLEKSGIVLNKNMIPYDARSPKDPSGVRLGTAALTSRGMKEKEMRIVAGLIDEAITKKAKPEETKRKVEKLTQKFPLP